jgi:alkanesulfonate monooxygenase SsuD/methylene tetrahydromethanopterin reductase-like flavin-dependent oxidoreductase (luciferase family)
VKLGVILPTFLNEATSALAVARECEALGIDGVFAYDHLWPMGAPTRPSLAPFPILAAVAARCPSLSVGPLVARVGMVGTEQLVSQFRSLALIAPGRVIAALGTGDTKGRDELEAYGLRFASAPERRDEVHKVVRRLQGLDEEMTIWIGAGSPSTNELAWQLGVALNVWGADLATVKQLHGRGPLTWAGAAPAQLHAWLDDLHDAGTQWAVFAPQVDVRALANWRRGGPVTKFR